MSRQADVPELYRGAINVWVEDAVVAAYFQEVWSDSDMHLLIAGGHPAVEALAKHADEHEFQNVFGVVDADFGASNHDHWLLPSKTFRRFVLPVHEIENLMLDSAAMAGCMANNNNKTAAEIDARMQQLAVRLVPYMACRAALSELRRSILDDFPTHPKRDAVPDLAAAASLICDSTWFLKLSSSTAVASTKKVQQRLAHYRSVYQTDLDSGAWRTTFSGKELFRDVASFFYSAKVRGQERDIDVAKAVGRWQVDNKCVPPVITQLRSALRTRVGL